MYLHICCTHTRVYILYTYIEYVPTYIQYTHTHTHRVLLITGTEVKTHTRPVGKLTVAGHQVWLTI